MWVHIICNITIIICNVIIDIWYPRKLQTNVEYYFLFVEITSYRYTKGPMLALATVILTTLLLVEVDEDTFWEEVDEICVGNKLREFHHQQDAQVGSLEPWWRHQMETFSALPTLCAGNSPVTGEFPTQRPVTRSFDVFFDRRLNKRLSKQSWGWWFETPSRSLWLHFLIKNIWLSSNISLEYLP